MATTRRVTVADLEGLTLPPGERWEIIDGELHVSKQPDWDHQETCNEIGGALHAWNRRVDAGRIAQAPGVIFAPDQAVAPDIVWISHERIAGALDQGGHLHVAPELVVEVLSAGPRNERRDSELKLRVYSDYGVREYWIANWRDRTVKVYRAHEGVMTLAATLTAEDTLTSPLLPGFAVPVHELFPARS